MNVILSPIAVPDLVAMIATEVVKRISPTAPVPDHAKDEQFTIAELAAYLRCSKVTILAYRRQGLPFYKMGHKILFSKSDVLAFMSRKR